MKRMKTYICRKCGMPFQKMVGGIILSDEEKELMHHPLCEACKARSADGALRQRRQKKDT